MKRVAIYGWVSAALAVAVAAVVGVAWLSRPAQRPITQADIDAAVLHTLQTKSLPSRTAHARRRRFANRWWRCAALRRRSPMRKPRPPRAPGVILRPHARNPPSDPGARRTKSSPGAGCLRSKEAPTEKREARHIGSGVVVTESGLVLTSYHVVADAKRVEVRFYDGQTSEALGAPGRPGKGPCRPQAEVHPRRFASRDARCQPQPCAGRGGRRGRLSVRHRGRRSPPV
ncbi:hypothetical protein ACTMU2_20440 [Cupriavidus basilensis]